MFDLKIRPALEQDCRDIARLFLIGSEGLAVEDVEPILRPFAILKDVGSLYLSALVVDPEYRDLGIGSWLLETASQRAVLHAAPRLSVVVLQRNQVAMGFYWRAGFMEINRTPLCPHPALPDWTGDAVLLTKPMDEPSKMSESKSQEK